MRTFLVLTLLCIATTVARAQKSTPDALTLILPSGKILHFENAEQRAKFEAGRERASQIAAAATPDPAVVAVQERVAREREERRQQERINASTQRSWLKIVQIMPDGILASYSSGYVVNGGYRTSIPADYEFSSELVFIECSPADRWVDGMKFLADVYPAGTYEYLSVLGAKNRIMRYKVNVQISP